MIKALLFLALFLQPISAAALELVISGVVTPLNGPMRFVTAVQLLVLSR